MNHSLNWGLIVSVGQAEELCGGSRQAGTGLLPGSQVAIGIFSLTTVLGSLIALAVKLSGPVSGGLMVQLAMFEQG